ncbi:hypothetical protein O4160_00045 [Rhodococcus sp. IEGM 1401]|uniref:hypothetical protein n=1 Tax=unclassified Rhodococcus (in: high G+C Gram-positive bacteria) TaxID=192944 RepID=UPI0022B48E81|nr:MULTISPECIES: hypothetical protein [unclassified Rhodococcus (in: high G+C Gram-positive bacteria)]MCZ4559226.1 hypothetical protein [Rhodococcus sp. IEGM 1401]MDI9919821.1 hypothetical protein [Rhodococcus sp. IEGM 1372]MDV8031805.1 hypothetical protein [Rhodococcus sp. IEGM 1414]
MRMPAKFMIVGAAAVLVTLGSVGALAIADDGPAQQRPSSISVEQPLSEADSASNPPAAPQQPATTRISDDRYDDDWDDWDDRNDDLDDRYDDDWDDRDDDRDDLNDRSDDNDDDLDDDNDDRDDDNDRDD